MDKKAFGRKVNSIRKSKGISSDKLSELVGKNSGSYIRMIETGQSGVSIEALIDICNVLGVSADYLLDADLNRDIVKSDSPLIALSKQLSARDLELLVIFAQTMVQFQSDEG